LRRRQVLPCIYEKFRTRPFRRDGQVLANAPARDQPA